MRTGKNHEGYSDPTASCAVGNLTHEEKKKEQKRKEKKKSGSKNNVLDNTHPDRSGNSNDSSAHDRNGNVLSLPAKGRENKKRVHREAAERRRRTDRGNKGDECKERRKAKEKTAKAE